MPSRLDSAFNSGRRHSRESGTAARKSLISIVMTSLPVGGAERVIVTLIRELLRQQIDVDLVLGKRKGELLPEVPMETRIVELGPPSGLPPAPLLLTAGAISWTQLLRLGLTRLPSAVRSIAKLRDYIETERPDAVLATLPANTLATLWARQLSHRKPRVLIREANTLSIQAGSETHAFDRLIPELAKKWYPRADGLVAVSDGARQDLADMIELPYSRIATIYNPVDVERVRHLAAAPLDPVGEAWFSDPDRPVLITVGRLEMQKDHETLIRAFAKVVAARPCRLVILGEGSLRSELEGLRDSLGLAGCVHLPGTRANPFGYIRRSAGFVLSSAWEGFPNVLLEAIACGCPVVSTDCPSGPSELLACGRFGALVKVGDPDELAVAMKGMLDAPIASGDTLVARACQFSPRQIARQYLEALLGHDVGRDANGPVG